MTPPPCSFSVIPQFLRAQNVFDEADPYMHSGECVSHFSKGKDNTFKMEVIIKSLSATTDNASDLHDAHGHTTTEHMHSVAYITQLRHLLLTEIHMMIYTIKSAVRCKACR